MAAATSTLATMARAAPTNGARCQMAGCASRRPPSGQVSAHEPGMTVEAPHPEQN